MSIHNVTFAPTPVTTGTPKASTPKIEDGGPSFVDTMRTAVAEVNNAQVDAANKAQGMATGKVSIDEAMITMEKADLSFRMMTQVKNKVVDAYKEIMRMNF